jgi:hypothetical protein
VAIHVTLKCRMLEFKENFILCNIDEINLILDDTFFEAHTMDVWQKSARLMLCWDGKEMLLKESYEFSRQVELTHFEAIR